MKYIKSFQLGKNKLTDNLINQVKTSFKNTELIKVSILQSCTRNREEAKIIAEQLTQKLGKNFTSRLIGYTIILKKWRKPRK